MNSVMNVLTASVWEIPATAQARANSSQSSFLSLKFFEMIPCRFRYSAEAFVWAFAIELFQFLSGFFHSFDTKINEKDAASQKNIGHNVVEQKG